MAAGKSVCTGPGCARTREKEIRKNRSDSSLERNMVGKEACGIMDQEVCRGWEICNDTRARKTSDGASTGGRDNQLSRESQ